MPIVRIELIGDGRSQHEWVQQLADDLGALFGSGPRSTWVKLTHTPWSGYAENGGAETGVAPVFVEVLKRQDEPLPDRRVEAREIARCVARILDRPLENTHVLYAPAGRQRIAFGGELVE